MNKRSTLISIIILLIIGLCYYISIIFVTPTTFIIWGNAYTINLVWNENQKPEIIQIAHNLQEPQIITIDGAPMFIKDNDSIFNLGIYNCPNIPATGFDAPSFEWVGRGSEWAGIMIKDKNGTYITSSIEEGSYGRPTCDTGIALPYKKI